MGRSHGKGIFGKGANVFLGPGVNVARVPLNGRNFEYISGEDPTLGAKLVSAEIKGIQDQGVIANVKHFVQNNQETNRFTINEVVDEKTHWELYMPPFQAAVEAGVLSAMCAYNKINGEYACENRETLSGELKDRLGFKGFVVSDWGATHSDVHAADAGLDMEMPGQRFFGDKLKQAVLSNEVTMDVLDDKIRRILYALIASGSMDRPITGSINANVTSEAHNQLARELAAAGVVLLKNENDMLPLRPEQKVAVFGNVIAAGGGSGHVEGPYVASGYDGIKRKCQAGLPTYSSMDNPDYSGVSDADVVVIFTSTTSSEGRDRTDLSFPGNELKVINAVTALASNKVVVVGAAPGAVLLPFADAISGLLLSFMPGQEAGNAIADVLYGDVNPSAKLPLTMPNAENEVGFTPDQYPGVNLTASYTEKLFIGYRWYDHHQIYPKFPFGYGLSYSTFKLTVAYRDNHNVTINIANTSERDGSEVVQVFSGHPGVPDEPERVLCEFQKVFVPWGQSKNVTFSLNDFYSPPWAYRGHRWVPPQSPIVIIFTISSSTVLEELKFALQPNRVANI
jgi:beta-glucosidase